MNIEISKEFLIENLKTVQMKALDGVYFKKQTGICKAWCEEIEFNPHEDGVAGYFLVAHFAKSWDLYSGDEYSPILDKNQHKWQEEALTLRMSLIDHLLMCLEKSTQEEIDKIISYYYVENV